MKFFKWRIFIISGFVCLLPVLLGVSVWSKLPDTMAIHFDYQGTPDNFSSKAFVVFGIPLMMFFLQAVTCFAIDRNVEKNGMANKFATITKWIIPVISVVLYIITLGFNMGGNLDIRKACAVIVGMLLIVTGNYMPKLDKVNNFKLNTEKARKINRFTGYATVVMGILFEASVFFPPIITVICLFLFIPYTAIILVYTLKIARK